VLRQVKLALHFQIPPQASLPGIVKTHRSSAERMALLRFARESLGENRGLCLACQAGRCFEKASASLFASVFSKTNPAFAQRITPVLFALPIRVYLGNPWLKNDPFRTE
jgi:hypothetical protein